ncbi:MAG: hypothetical protein ACRDBG_27420 [Waterburya sp.]
MTRTQTLAAIAANNSRRYYEVERPSILLRYRDLTKEGAADLLKNIDEGKVRSTDNISRAIDAILEKTKPSHVIFFEQQLNNISTTGRNDVKAIPSMQPRSASGLIKALKQGILPTEISSPLFKWLPFLRETAKKSSAS